MTPVPTPTLARSAVDELMAQVADHPDDDELRLVLADVLLEKGDPRGEFIALQMQAQKRPLSAEESAREAYLRRMHEGDWLGPIAHTTMDHSRVWRRGFLEECEFLVQPGFKDATGHPAWSTVRVLTCNVGPERLDTLLHPVLRRVRVFRTQTNPVLRAVATSDPPWAIEELSGGLGYPRMLPELLQARGLPSLRALSQTTWFSRDVQPADLRRLWQSPLGKQLTLFRFLLDPTLWPAWCGEVLRAPFAVEIDMAGVLLRIDGDALALRPGEGWAARVNLLAPIPAGRFKVVEVDEKLRGADVDREVERLRRRE
jgi:uncharacterized protein (TIGR02996 family)